LGWLAVKTRGLISAAFLLGLTGVFFLSSYFGPRELIHEGKPLSEWIGDLSSGDDQKAKRAYYSLTTLTQ